MSDDGARQMQAMIERVRVLPDLVSDAAPDAASALRAAIVKHVDAGTAPDGTPWKPRKEDGGRPMANAAAAVRVAPTGNKLFAAVRGPEARHSRGIARGGIERPIFPSSGLPDGYARAITGVLTAHFTKRMGGG